MSGILSYGSNNSGGRWWLKDKDWEALEDAGWTVHWSHPQSQRHTGYKVDPENKDDP